MKPGNIWYLVEVAEIMQDPVVLHETCRMIPLYAKDALIATSPVQLRKNMAHAYSWCFPCLHGVCHLQKGHAALGCPNWKEVVDKIDARSGSKKRSARITCS